VIGGKGLPKMEAKSGKIKLKFHPTDPNYPHCVTTVSFPVIISLVTIAARLTNYCHTIARG
jgi:hypothetical protein